MKKPKRTPEEIKQSILALQIEAMKRSGAADEEIKEFEEDAAGLTQERKAKALKKRGK